jgi:glucuronate isomerase
MPVDSLSDDLNAALSQIPIIDPHSHIDPLRPVSQSLEDILGYHYYTELAHSAGLPQSALSKELSPRERVGSIMQLMERYDNTAQYGWFVQIAQKFLGFDGSQVTARDTDMLFSAAEKTFAQPDWQQQVLATTKLEKIFLTNEFDDPLTGFDTSVYVPCLRTDTLVFQLHKPETRRRLTACTGIHIRDGTRQAVPALYTPWSEGVCHLFATHIPSRPIRR